MDFIFVKKYTGGPGDWIQIYRRGYIDAVGVYIFGLRG
jgi:hypothetical protein